ncbi:mitochondrial arginine transporter BAC2-like [Malania oleifera]|uniref:mitochondrial arginine transporter BAC2-like n=1 Tax=Malania oleifera TaxID=397392 RepID=UPI0025AE6988|nr:mitochondrial arginine transporter BAC2-like [Malania oleifera]
MSWGKEFVVGGFKGKAGVISDYPLDTLKIRQQHSKIDGSTLGILRKTFVAKGPTALYRGMGAPLSSVTFQIYTVLSRAFDSSVAAEELPSYKGVALGGIGIEAL